MLGQNIPKTGTIPNNTSIPTINLIRIFKKNTTYSLNPAAVRLSVRAGTLNRKASGMTRALGRAERQNYSGHSHFWQLWAFPTTSTVLIFNLENVFFV